MPGALSLPRFVPELVNDYACLPGVVAVVVAGSLATGMGDAGSDLDLYVYAPQPPPLEPREAIATRYASRREVGNEFWEPGDEWINAAFGRHVDVMYRAPAWIEGQLDRLLIRHEASVGYSTCFWHNVLHSRALADPSGWYSALQADARRPYPEPLKRAIIAKNHPLLRSALSSYGRQIERAPARGDALAVQHRLTALLASYFDILFAVNGLPHPGEKRMLAFALDRCPRRPADLEAAITRLLAWPAGAAHDPLPARIGALLDGLDTLLAAEGLLAPK